MHMHIVSVLLHGPTSYDCPRTDSSPRPATFQLRYNDVHVRVWFATLPRCPVDNPAFHSAPIRIPSQPSCSQLPRKLHVLTSPVVLAFISCMLYIARSVFSWRCPISPDTGRSQEGMRCSRHLVVGPGRPWRGAVEDSQDCGGCDRRCVTRVS